VIRVWVLILVINVCVRVRETQSHFSRQVAIRFIPRSRYVSLRTAGVSSSEGCLSV
jgi:hypothetical protein